MSADEIIQRAATRAQQTNTGALPAFNYTKVTLTEELDGSGNIRERKEKVYDASFRDGASHLNLTEVNGHAPTADDRKKQRENASMFQRLLGDSKKPGDNGSFLTPEIAAHFNYKLLGETNLNGRAAYRISFAPKSPEPPAHDLVDRLLNRVSGTLWIDREEFEIARADVSLESEVNVLGGFAGSLKKLAYTLVRTRIADGVWFNTLSSGVFEGRKLLDSTCIKTKSEATNFRPAGEISKS
ncbi:MAG TPA: hypothetical protein VFM25_11730 [Verrucomicrobiae bacterium]|nr:hypothetical protein [Verrucomicrobiae bacterium]